MTLAKPVVDCPYTDGNDLLLRGGSLGPMCLCAAHRHGSMNSRSEVGESAVAPRAVIGSVLGYKLLECLGYPVCWFGRRRRSIRRSAYHRCCRHAFFLYGRVAAMASPSVADAPVSRAALRSTYSSAELDQIWSEEAPARNILINLALGHRGRATAHCGGL